jgi:acetyl-CoA carboxylase carboxyltransferase component
LDALSEQFKASLGNMETLMGDMQQVMQTVHAAGGDKAVSRHRSRNKWLPRERINMLLDPGSPFLELSPLAGHGLYGEPITGGKCLLNAAAGNQLQLLSWRPPSSFAPWHRQSAALAASPP